MSLSPQVESIEFGGIAIGLLVERVQINAALDLHLGDLVPLFNLVQPRLQGTAVVWSIVDRHSQTVHRRINPIVVAMSAKKYNGSRPMLHARCVCSWSP